MTQGRGEGSLDIDGCLLLVGAGKMGGALLEGWLRLGLDPRLVHAVDPAPGPELAAHAERGVGVHRAVSAALPSPAAVVLAVKPQSLAEALHPVAGKVTPGTVVISILAGKTIAAIEAGLPPGAAVVRAMPNTPAAVGRGITVAIANRAATQEQRARADALLAAVGEVAWTEDEGLLDAVTGVSGSGPAYVFLLVEALAKAGEAAGLPRDLAARLARATVSGAGELLFRSPLQPEELRRNVTSPGGTTAAALDVLLAADGLDPLLSRAVAAAARRAGELAG